MMLLRKCKDLWLEFTMNKAPSLEQMEIKNYFRKELWISTFSCLLTTTLPSIILRERTNFTSDTTFL